MLSIPSLIVSLLYFQVISASYVGSRGLAARNEYYGLEARQDQSQCGTGVMSILISSFLKSLGSTGKTYCNAVLGSTTTTTTITSTKAVTVSVANPNPTTITSGTSTVTNALYTTTTVPVTVRATTTVTPVAALVTVTVTQSTTVTAAGGVAKRAVSENDASEGPVVKRQVAAGSVMTSACRCLIGSGPTVTRTATATVSSTSTFTRAPTSTVKVAVTITVLKTTVATLTQATTAVSTVTAKGATSTVTQTVMQTITTIVSGASSITSSAASSSAAASSAAASSSDIPSSTLPSSTVSSGNATSSTASSSSSSATPTAGYSQVTTSSDCVYTGRGYFAKIPSDGTTDCKTICTLDADCQSIASLTLGGDNYCQIGFTTYDSTYIQCGSSTGASGFVMYNKA